MIGIAMGAAMGVQILWLTWPTLQGAVAAFAAAALVQQLWRYRDAMDPHTDMHLLMCSFGGLTVVLYEPSCHAPSSFVAMSTSMLILGMPPMVMLSRCVQRARHDGTLLRMLTLDVAGMGAGMGVAHLACAGASPMVSHFAMLLGMSAGMAAARRVYTLCHVSGEVQSMAVKQASVRQPASQAPLRVAGNLGVNASEFREHDLGDARPSA